MALIPNAQQLLNALIQGEVDWVQLDFSQIQRAQEAAKNGKIKVIKIEMNAPERSSLDFNMRRAPMSDVKVRQALFLATDRNRINADAYRGLAFPATSAIPEQFKELNDPSVNYDKLYPFDPQKAAALLDEAGYKMQDGKRFSVELTYIATSPFDAIAKSLAAQWKEIGVDVRLAGLDFADLARQGLPEERLRHFADLAHRTIRPDLGRRSQLHLQRRTCPLHEPDGLL